MSNQALKCLESVSGFCKLHLELCNIHTVDFIVHDHWNLLPVELREEIACLELDQMSLLLRTEIPEFINQRDFPSLYHFVMEAKHHTIEAMLPCLPKLSFVLSKENQLSPSVPVNILMSQKKSHEVEVLATVITSLAHRYGIHEVIDFGSGKGYLSAHLALNYDLNVLGIESIAEKSIAASQRNKKLEKRLVKKKSRYRQKSAFSNTADIHQTGLSSDTDGNFKNTAFNDVQQDQLLGYFHCKTLTVDERTDFRDILKDFCSASKATSDGKGSSVLFSALHACGNLLPSVLKQFKNTDMAKVLCCIGCCYQHVTECFHRDPVPAKDDLELEDTGFPLSRTLSKCRFTLGRNARMLASQSVERLVCRNSVVNKALFYRAVLQAILVDHGSDFTTDLHVGKLAIKCSSFEEYVERALEKLQLKHIKLSDQDVKRYSEKYATEEKKLYAFQLLRVLLAPCLEALLLLDRLVFLLEKEKEVQEACIVPLFDPLVSPRCYALIAVKR